ncbi:hypothetical protein [Mesorhizobium intechi]|nr:hypothetical protein [Mesorhizobium intechi]
MFAILSITALVDHRGKPAPFRKWLATGAIELAFVESLIASLI